MIQVYNVENTNFESNGDMVLLPTSCNLTCGINDTWELTLSHSVDMEGRWKQLDVGVVLAVPTFQNEKQLFRVTKCEKDESAVFVTASPIFFDSANDCFLMDVRPTNKSCLLYTSIHYRFLLRSQIQLLRSSLPSTRVRLILSPALDAI